MKNKLCIIFLLFSCRLLNAQDQYFKDKLDQYFTVLEKSDRVYGSVAIVKKGQLLYSRVLGAKNPDNNGLFPMSAANPKLRIASISKSITAVMIM
ncbi:MAG: hypothetical protein WCP74_07100 [Sphingobacteriia bacterium]|jgi:CubicO group peptidase (beta-lactamase class C family)